MTETFASYPEALGWLREHYNLERHLGGADVNAPTLDRMVALMGLMGDPQNSIPAIHITGTNGKGSASRMAVELIGAMGLDAGAYTSPHIIRVNDRITVANEPLSDEDFVAALRDVAAVEPYVVDAVGAPPNYFEVLSAAAYSWFATAAVDVNVVEVGMGGRWDATNVIDAEVAVITNIGGDHLEIIGPTLADVTREKAGIISERTHVVCGETDPDLVDIVRAATVGELWVRGIDFDVLEDRLAVGGRMVDLFTPFGRHEDVFLPAHGRHQSHNLVAAVAAVEAFFGRSLADEVLAEGLEKLTLPARFEVLGRQPLVVIDGAHNAEGAAAAATTLFTDFATDAASVLVFGSNQPHDPGAFLAALDADRFAHVVATAADWPRAIPTADIEAAARAAGLDTSVAPDVATAVDVAVERAGADGVVLVTGSLYVAAEARVHLVG